jgi:hypothetical protein
VTGSVDPVSMSTAGFNVDSRGLSDRTRKTACERRKRADLASQWALVDVF